MNSGTAAIAHAPLVMPRRFAIRLLHEAQTADSRGFIAAVGARQAPDLYLIDANGDELAAFLELAQSRFAAQSRALWALYLHRPGLPTAPDTADFAIRPELPRLSASLATKGVLQLRAWILERDRVIERELQLAG